MSSRKNLLLSMSAQEKLCMAKIEQTLKKEGASKHDLREQKKEALDYLRKERNAKRAKVVKGLIDDMITNELSG